MKFGFFDSGLGGLLMMQSCIQKYPQYNYIYVGDTQNLPYGPRDSVEIARLMEPYLLFLFEEKKCDYVVIACNTASVRALPLFIKKHPHYQKRLVDIVAPTKKFLKDALTPDSELLILATQGTVASGVYVDVDSLQVYQVSMPGLVELIESEKREGALIMVEDVLSYYPSVHQLLLGCTHYVWLQEDLQKKYPNIRFIGQDSILQQTIKKLFQQKKSSHVPNIEYYVSGSVEVYSQKYNVPFKKLPLD